MLVEAASQMEHVRQVLLWSYKKTKGNDKSTLVLNRTTTQNKSVEVTLFNRHGEATPIPAFT
jgi:hypothetical protein